MQANPAAVFVHTFKVGCMVYLPAILAYEGSLERRILKGACIVCIASGLCRIIRREDTGRSQVDELSAGRLQY